MRASNTPCFFIKSPLRCSCDHIPDVQSHHTDRIMSSILRELFAFNIFSIGYGMNLSHAPLACLFLQNDELAKAAAPFSDQHIISPRCALKARANEIDWQTVSTQTASQIKRRSIQAASSPLPSLRLEVRHIQQI